MKNILLICDKLTANHLQHWLQTQAQNNVFRELTTGSALPHIQVIASETDWYATHFPAPDKMQVIQVILLQELRRTDWPSLRNGYTVAEQMLQRSDLKDQTLNLQFISLYSRQQLRDAVSALHQPFVKYFFHLPYPPKNLTAVNFSPRHYQFIRNYCLTESGQVDILAHDLRKFTQGNYTAQELNDQIRRALELASPVVGKEAAVKAQQLIEQLTQDPSAGNCRLIQQQQLPVLIELLAQRRDEYNFGQTPEKMPYNALIVEDDPLQLEKLETALRPYFADVTGLTHGTEARELLRTGQYQALFVDMELLDADGFIQPTPGVSLLDLCENEELPVATRIVTSLGRRALKELVDKPEGHILHKSYSDRILGGNENMGAFFEKIAQEIRKKLENKANPSPSTGPFGPGKFLKKLYLRLETERGKELTHMMREIQKKAEGFFIDCIPAEEIDMEFGKTQSLGRDENLKLLKTILLHRAIALLHTKQAPDNWLNFGRYTHFDPKKEIKYTGLHTGYCDLFRPKLADNHKKYFVTQLGFSGSWENTEKNERTTCVWVKIDLENIFKAERKWFDLLNIDQLLERPLKEEMPTLFHGLVSLLKTMSENPRIAYSILANSLQVNKLRKAQLENFWEELRDAGSDAGLEIWENFEEKLDALVLPNLPAKPGKTP